eukprot:TRINITY_DN996_c0_g1_i3.p1 TRINITY_DN996_c0_g1~~TRINITY_DN996_c0_g1_i3.p1  ORF type:complete len:608 (+),score=88.71 TRINITY_DN996_c0_g1_i3:174-1997(+)
MASHSRWECKSFWMGSRRLTTLALVFCTFTLGAWADREEVQDEDDVAAQEHGRGFKSRRSLKRTAPSADDFDGSRAQAHGGRNHHGRGHHHHHHHRHHSFSGSDVDEYGKNSTRRSGAWEPAYDGPSDMMQVQSKLEASAKENASVQEGERLDADASSDRSKGPSEMMQVGDRLETDARESASMREGEGEGDNKDQIQGPNDMMQAGDRPDAYARESTSMREGEGKEQDQIQGPSDMMQAGDRPDAYARESTSMREGEGKEQDQIQGPSDMMQVGDKLETDAKESASMREGEAEDEQRIRGPSDMMQVQSKVERDARESASVQGYGNENEEAQPQPEAPQNGQEAAPAAPCDTNTRKPCTTSGFLSECRLGSASDCKDSFCRCNDNYCAEGPEGAIKTCQKVKLGWLDHVANGITAAAKTQSVSALTHHLAKGMVNEGLQQKEKDEQEKKQTAMQFFESMKIYLDEQFNKLKAKIQALQEKETSERGKIKEVNALTGAQGQGGDGSTANGAAPPAAEQQPGAPQGDPSAQAPPQPPADDKGCSRNIGGTCFTLLGGKGCDANKGATTCFGGYCMCAVNHCVRDIEGVKKCVPQATTDSQNAPAAENV